MGMGGACRRPQSGPLPAPRSGRTAAPRAARSWRASLSACRRSPSQAPALSSVSRPALARRRCPQPPAAGQGALAGLSRSASGLSLTPPRGLPSSPLRGVLGPCSQAGRSADPPWAAGRAGGRAGERRRLLVAASALPAAPLGFSTPAGRGGFCFWSCGSA